MSNNKQIQIDALIKMRNCEIDVMEMLLIDCINKQYPPIVIKMLLDTCDEKDKLVSEYYEQIKYKLLNATDNG